jgi:D-arabinose 1-dehydrogenase-like Zn-dependent alcohol dehydrogenase
MKGYALVEWEKPLQEYEAPNPKPAGKEVLVAVDSCGLCHSDLHIQDGLVGGDGTRQDLSQPFFLGHEIYGRIREFGPETGLTTADIGKPVIVFPWVGCGECPACENGHDENCPTPRYNGIQVAGGFADMVLVRDAKFCVDAAGIDPLVAGLYACSGVTAFNALKKLGPGKEDWIAVVGVGGVGLMTIAVAKALGFEKVAAIDIDEAKLPAATEYGADAVFSSKLPEVAKKIKAETSGGVTGLVDLVGSSATAALGVELLRPNAVQVTVGMAGGELRVPLMLLTVMQLQFRGSFVGTLQDLKEVVDLARQGKLKPMPGHPVPIQDVNRSMDLLRAGKVSGRILLTHNRDSA